MNEKLAPLQLYLFALFFVKEKNPKQTPNLKPKQQPSLQVFLFQVKQITLNRQLYALLQWSCFFGGLPLYTFAQLQHIGVYVKRKRSSYTENWFFSEEVTKINV